MIKEIENKLPGYNCGSCGYSNCAKFSRALSHKETTLDACPLMQQEKHKGNKAQIADILRKNFSETKKRIHGVLDKYEADILLSPLKGEHACREVLLLLTETNATQDSVIKYRPIGCPIVHFAKILKREGMLVTVVIIGPCDRGEDNDAIIPVGNCLVIGFEGEYSGKDISVGETIRFLPKHCMMQKVHSGVVVNIENKKVYIEGIDLKVWTPPKTINNYKMETKQ